MPHAPSDVDALHLPNLSIQGFGGIRELSIPRLGHVTLFAGQNGVGKTTLLDAVQVYAARGRYEVVEGLLQSREEYVEEEDEDGDKYLAPHWEALFHGRSSTVEPVLSVGPIDEDRRLQLRLLRTTDLEEDRLTDIEPRIPRYLLDSDTYLLEASIAGNQDYIPMVDRRRSRIPYRTRRSGRSPLGNILCQTLGPGLPSNRQIARFWDKIALTEDEPKIIAALNLIFQGAVDGVTMIGDDRGVRYSYGRRAVVRMAGGSQPIPLKSLGDGAARLFGVALALANSQDGFLLIDEVENGIHHSVQHDFWTMVLKTAFANNVQVLATTHGWSCVTGFAQAAIDLPDVEGTLIRVDRRGDLTRAVEYTEEELATASERGIEVR